MPALAQSNELYIGLWSVLYLATHTAQSGSSKVSCEFISSVFDIADTLISSYICIIICYHPHRRLAIQLGQRQIHWDGQHFCGIFLHGICSLCIELSHLWLYTLHPQLYIISVSWWCLAISHVMFTGNIGYQWRRFERMVHYSDLQVDWWIVWSKSSAVN